MDWNTIQSPSLRHFTDQGSPTHAPHTHGTNATDHNGQVNERTLNHLVDRGAEGSLSDGLGTDDGERRNTELETLEEA